MTQAAENEETTPVTTFLKTHLAVHPLDNQRTRGHRDRLEAAKQFNVLALKRRSKDSIRRADSFWDSCNRAYDEIQQELLANNGEERETSSAFQQLRSLLSSNEDIDHTFHPNDFGLLKKLGQGGYGAVYKALHYPTGHVVALKEVDAGSSPVETRDQRTLPLDCGIVPCYGTFLALERTQVRKRRENEAAAPKLKTWMVLKYCHKGSLADKLKEKGRLSPKEAAHVIKRLSKILAPLYKDHGLVHNDVKPANVLYDGSTLLLCDLGCARKGPWQNGPRLGGTYAHMSPEKLLQRKLGHGGGCCYYNQDKIDVWAMGILLCQMVFGQHPCGEIRKFVQAPTLTASSDTEPLYDRLEECFSKLTLPSTSDAQLNRLLQDMLALDCGERLSLGDIKQQAWIRRHDKWTKKLVSKLKQNNPLRRPLCLVSPSSKDMYKGEPSATEATTTTTSMDSRGISLRRLNIVALAPAGPEQQQELLASI